MLLTENLHKKLYQSVIKIYRNIGNMGNKNINSIVPVKDKQFTLCIINPQKNFFSGGLCEIKKSENIIGSINKLRFLCYIKIDTLFMEINNQYPSNNIKSCNFHDDILCVKNDFICKVNTYYSAFSDTHLELLSWLQTKNITDLILVGIGTDNFFIIQL